MKIPGPDHPITVTPAGQRWRAMFNGHVIADSAHAVVLKEAHYKPVVYFPREDVSMEYMSATTHTTYCPYKGNASYFTMLMNGEFAENSIWSYVEPYPAMHEITGLLGFYPDKFEIYPVEDAAVNAHPAPASDVDQVVMHTDSGGGVSQREQWTPTVDQPLEDPGLR